MKLLTPIIEKEHKLLLITEPTTEFLCSFCKNQDNCSEYGYYAMFGGNPFYNLNAYDNKFTERIWKLLFANSDIVRGVLVAVSEPTLVKYRKDLYQLSKDIFNYNKKLDQYVFINTDLLDVFELKSAYKYLTYVDYVMQNTNPKTENFTTYINCIFDNAVYIDLTKSFTAGKPVYTNL